MKRSQIPSLDDLRALEAVARLGSIRAAADDLFLTHGAVSRRVNKLSGDLVLPLVEPDGRGIRLTEEGKEISSVVSSFFAELQGTIEKLRDMPTAPSIALSCERSVAMRWLIPNLSEFQSTHPEINFNLSVGGGHFDFKKEGITLALRRMDFNVDPRWKVTRLFDEEVGPVMVSEQKKNFESGNYVALCSKTRPDAWRNYLSANADAPPPHKFQFMDHHFLQIEAASSGLGVALSPKVLAYQDIKNHKLIAPHGFQKDGSYYGLIHPNDVDLTDEVIALQDWLISLVGAMDEQVV